MIPRNIRNDPDLPLRFLEPLRTSLWEPETIWDLQHNGAITGRQLEDESDAWSHMFVAFDLWSADVRQPVMRVYYENLLSAGVRIFERLPPYLHA